MAEYINSCTRLIELRRQTSTRMRGVLDEERLHTLRTEGEARIATNPPPMHSTLSPRTKRSPVLNATGRPRIRAAFVSEKMPGGMRFFFIEHVFDKPSIMATHD